MNTLIKRQRVGKCFLTGVAVLTALFCLSAATTFAGNPNPGVLPINSSPYGKSYGKWTVAWWQWALGFPAAQNPLLDGTGQYAGQGQSGPVWFLAGTLGDSAERTVNIPAGKAIFMPAHNWIFGAGVFDCDPTVPGVTCDVPTLREKAATAVTSVQTLEVTIDGVLVQNIRNYRALSPDTFSVTFPEGAVYGIPAGELAPHVSDGYWLMLAPFNAGEHTVKVRTVSPDYGIDSTVIHHLRVN